MFKLAVVKGLLMLDKLLMVLNDVAWAYSLTEQKYVFISPNVSQVVGFSAEDMISDKDKLQKSIVPEDVELFLQSGQDLKPDDSAEIHYRIKVSNKIKWIVEKRTYFVDPDRNAEIVLSVIKDVSDQKAIKRNLDEALGDFSVLFDRSPNPMWIYEATSLRIIKVNQSAIEHYGYSKTEFLDMTIRDVRPKLDLAAFNEYIFRKGITKGKKVGSNTGGIWRHQTKQGDIIYAEITGHEIKYSDSTCRIISVNDVTQRVLFEQERDIAISLQNADQPLKG